LFVFDWMRNWVMALRVDANENYKGMEPFLPVSGDFKRPIDLTFGQDGGMYMLEYGSVYGIDNEDARLVKIEYNPGNRAPVAKATVTDSIGVAPLKVTFSSTGTNDFDEDKLTYSWMFDGQTVGATEANPAYIYTADGVYQAILKVTDQEGAVGVDTVEIKVGNAMPQVAIHIPGNKSFYWGKEPLKYTIQISDKEDVKADPKKVQVYFDYNPQPKKNEPQMGHQILTTVETNTLGKTLIANSDCKACHTIDKVSVGPAFVAVAKRYKGQEGAVVRLANKIITGGGGVWGEHAMSAHPQVPLADASEMVKYILSLSDAKQQKQNLPMQGAVAFNQHTAKDKNGQYTLLAAYTDKGGKTIGPLTNSEVITFRPAKVATIDADKINNIDRWGNSLGNAKHGSYYLFKNIDLSNIKQLTYSVSANPNAKLELRLDSPTGPVVSSASLEKATDWKKKSEVTTPVTPTTGKQDLYFVVVNPQATGDVLNLEYIQFRK